MITRRSGLAGAAAAVFGARAGHAQSGWPERPISLLVGFAPGSTTDVAARIVAEPLGADLGQRVIVENRPGAASRIAMEAAARAPKDGYTLFVGTAANVTGDSLNPGSKTFVRDLVPIALLGSVPNLLVVSTDLGIDSVAGLMARARAQPDTITYGSPGIGTVPHLQGELFAQVAGARMVHVPYSGSNQAVTDLLGGRISMTFAPASSALEHVRAGKLRALATARERSPAAPDIPAAGEVGLPGLDTGIWYGLMAPTGTPDDVLARIAVATAKAGTAPATRSALGKQMIDVLEGGPEAFRALLVAETRKWNEVVAKAGLAKK
jgi:tripartite-type tricarboxylate transporter receptor subunit TctC